MRTPWVCLRLAERGRKEQGRGGRTFERECALHPHTNSGEARQGRVSRATWWPEWGGGAAPAFGGSMAATGGEVRGQGCGKGRAGVTSLGSAAGPAARQPAAGRAGCRRSRPPWPAAHCGIPLGARSQVPSAPRPAGGPLLKAFAADSTPNFPGGRALAAAGGG